jgi:hypothetical protein
LLEQIPDTPLWVETRGALLAGGDIFGEPGAAVVRSPWKDLLSIVGRPTDEALDAAFDGAASTVDVLAQVEDAEHGAYLMDMPGGPARIYAAGESCPRLPIVEGDYLLQELFAADAPRLRHLPDPLRTEIEDELGETRIVAAITDGLPVAFCYPGSLTARWWDVSIDTMEGYRRRGLAAVAFGGMCERMLREGRRAVWGAMEWNEASWRLADKLGLERVGELLVWTAHTFNEEDFEES